MQISQHPGPVEKAWPERNVCTGIVLHSMEGGADAAMHMLDGNPAVSWHYSVLKGGTILQHYADSVSCWHAGSKAQNLRLIGIEHEGKAGDPLTPAQLASSVALVRELCRVHGLPMSRVNGNKTLWEHNEVPGAATTCPNGRIPWEAYVPEYPVNTNIADGFDAGLARIHALNAARSSIRAFRQAFGNPADMKRLVDEVFDE